MDTNGTLLALSNGDNSRWTYISPAWSRRWGTSDELFYRAFGPDAILRNSLMMNGTLCCIYVDRACVFRVWMQTAYPTALATNVQIPFKTSMNAARIAVEWNYEKVKQESGSQGFHGQLQIPRLPAGSLYDSILLLKNFKNYSCGVSQPSSYFFCSPTTLDRYLYCSE